MMYCRCDVRKMQKDDGKTPTPISRPLFEEKILALTQKISISMRIFKKLLHLT